MEAMAEIIEQNGTCRVVDLAKHFGVSHVTVTRIVTRLQGEGLLRTKKYRPIELATKESEAMAPAVEDRLRILTGGRRRFQTPVVAIDAEGIEHHVSPQTLKKFNAFVQGQV